MTYSGKQLQITSLCLFLGARTVQHFNRPEDPKRFTKPEVYRRPATNIAGDVWQDYGRPTEGYYAQRNPSKWSLLQWNKSTKLHQTVYGTIVQKVQLR